MAGRSRNGPRASAPRASPMCPRPPKATSTSACGKRSRWAVRRTAACSRGPASATAVNPSARCSARALATEATHLLMDEPTANLDFGNQALILDEVSRLREAGSAVLFSTHHPDHALAIADRAVLVRGGGIMASGATGEVVNSANLSALYGRAVEVARVTSADGTGRRVCIPGAAPR